MSFPIRIAAAAALGLAALQVQAASIFFEPAQQAANPGDVVSFDLVMDFALDEATLGGGIDLDVSDNLSFIGFTPSSWFTTVPDPAFTGFGTEHADAEYEIHFGHFNGLSGRNVLGSIEVQVLDLTDPGRLDLAENIFWGGFYGVDLQQQHPTLTGATVTAVPEPATALLWLLGAAGVAARQRRRAG